MSDAITTLAIHLSNGKTPQFSEHDPATKTALTLRPVNPLSKPAILSVAAPHQAALGEVAIFEWTEYLLEGPSLRQVELPGMVVNQLKEGLYRFEVKNRVGQLRLKVKLDHSWYELPLAVLSRKYATPETHLDFFSALLEDLIKRSVQLPFSITQPTAFAADESPEPPTLLFVYHYLRQYGPELQAALETILGNPHRMLAYDDELMPLAQATYVDAVVLESIINHPQHLTRTHLRSPIAKALQGHAPARLWQSRSEETFDTPPNRFAKQFLTELATWSSRLGEVDWLTSYLPPLETIRDGLSYTQHHPVWDEVSPLTRFPAENQVLLKRYGYREWANLWRLFHQARLPVWREAEEAIDARDIATLYEIWCFFALADSVGETLGIGPYERQWRLDLMDKRGLGYRSQVIFGQTGYRLTYNEGFGRSPHRSYSVALRPDFTLHGPDNLRFIFDAKFRFDRTVFETEDEMNEVAETQNIVKKADLYKMHTYRDALRAQAAVTLYPGDVDIFYHTDASIRAEVDWQALLGGEWDGVGAGVMKPTQE